MLDRYTFDQLGLFARSVITHQSNMLDMLLSPMLGAQGVEYKPGSVVDSEKKADPRSDQEKEDALLAAFSRSPIGLRTVHTSGDSDG